MTFLLNLFVVTLFIFGFGFPVQFVNLSRNTTESVSVVVQIKADHLHQ